MHTAKLAPGMDNTMSCVLLTPKTEKFLDAEETQRSLWQVSL